MNKKDEIFRAPGSEQEKFKFDGQVADVFPDMLQRSIPGYTDILRMIEMFSAAFCRPDANYYDLGSSLGAVSTAMQKGIKEKGGQIIAVDNSPAMIRRSQNLRAKTGYITPVRLICADIRDIRITNAAVVVLNYTLQFIKPHQRDNLIRQIYDGLLPGGILLLSEKMCFNDEIENKSQNDWYYAFKKFNGYSQMEISRKREALENVLMPEKWEEHHRRLTGAGFKDVYQWHRFFNFTSIFARK